MPNVQTVIDRANVDEEFRRQLKANPASALKAAGMEVPKEAAIEVIDTRRGDIYLMLGARTNITEVDQMMDRAERDAAFKALLLRDPKAALEAHTGEKLPPKCNVHVREADPNTVYLYLPDPPDADRALSDDDLEAVAGGLEPISMLVGAMIALAGAGAGAATVVWFTRPTGTLNALNVD